jgi:dipeptidyl aminopeptidase/acylaminoacyl peptidase
LYGHFDACPFLEDGRILMTWQDPSHPSRVIALDRQTGSGMSTLIAAGDAPEGKPWRSISFASENGDTIQGWLVVPDGEGPFPTILHTHGGPSAVAMTLYAPESQTWVDCGFAFLTINYHGSTTFGRTFERSIDQRLGDLEVEDMASAYHWLVDEGIARPDAVFLTGGSYGGYLTLLGLGRHPELWAGGMAVVAVADWTVMYEDESEMLRGYQRALFGGSPEETPDRHKKSSPITYASNVRAPILVIQGSNDTRCPARQMKGYEAKLKSLGKEIDVHWFDAGHGSRAQEQQIDHQERKLRFAFGVLDR